MGGLVQCAAKSTIQESKAALGSLHASETMERVHIDILGPLPASNKGNKVILMMVDKFTKWLESGTNPDQSAELLAKVTMDTLFSRFGVPVQLHSDLSQNFVKCLEHFVGCCRSPRHLLPHIDPASVDR